MVIFKAMRREIWQIYDNIQYEVMRKRIKKEARRRHERQEFVNRGYIETSPPDATPFQFRQAWYCGDCDRLNEVFFDKYAVVIASERKKLKFWCMDCGGERCSDRMNTSNAPIDSEVIEFWLKDENSYFLSQDEDLLIAGLPVASIISLVDRAKQMDTNKGRSLVEALAVKFRDKTYQPHERDKLVAWLSDNRDAWDQPATWQYLRDDINKRLD